jgi:hypothetical protein
MLRLSLFIGAGVIEAVQYVIDFYHKEIGKSLEVSNEYCESAYILPYMQGYVP